MVYKAQTSFTTTHSGLRARIYASVICAHRAQADAGSAGLTVYLLGTSNPAAAKHKVPVATPAGDKLSTANKRLEENMINLLKKKKTVLYIMS